MATQRRKKSRRSPKQSPHRVVCRHCRRRFLAITFPHLVRKHGYDPEHPIEDYKRRFKVSVVVCKETACKLSRATVDYWDQNPVEPYLQRTHWTKEEAEAWVRSRSERPRTLLARDAPRDLRFYVRSHLQMTWAAFVESLGIKPAVARKRRNWSKASVIEEIRRRAKAGEPVTHTAVFLSHQALVRWARRLFGSWDAARRAAGV